MIINSLLDQDFYKFTMGQAVLHQFPDFQVEYRFRCRNKGIVWTVDMIEAIEREIDHLCTLSFTDAELDFLGGIRFLKPYFIDFLRLYRPARKHVTVSQADGLSITIKGPWFLTIFFEIPVLAIVNEVYFNHTTDFNAIAENGRRKLAEKIEVALREGLRFSEFGTRRRYSFGWQQSVIETLQSSLPNTIYTGTSNVHFSRLGKTAPIGTMAHEFIQAGQAVDDVTLAHSQCYMLQKWVDEYRGDLGIALSDTLGLDKFLIDFDRYFSKLYDGVRHDSGDPAVWAERLIAHYERLRIDPRTKTLVFSDGLDFPKAAALWKRFHERANVIFGIGTNLTNDFGGVTPLNIVVKLTECNGRPVAKLSDSPGKTMCEDEAFLRYLKTVVGMG
jgi:nicotinate phosphoribosyltransferase